MNGKTSDIVGMSAEPGDTPDEFRSIEDRNEEQRRRFEREYQKRIESFRSVLGTREGQEVIGFVIFEMCGGLRRSSADAPFNQGERNVGLILLELCAQADPTAVVSILERKTARHGR